MTGALQSREVFILQINPNIGASIMQPGLDEVNNCVNYVFDYPHMFIVPHFPQQVGHLKSSASILAL